MNCPLFIIGDYKILKEICQFIEDQSFGPPWTIGVTLFAGHMPVKDKNGAGLGDRILLVLENTPGDTIGELPDRVDKMIQIWNRASGYFQARADAKEIYTFLHGSAGWELAEVEESGYLVMVIDGVGSPAPIENPDEKGFFVFSTNYIWRIQNTP